MNEHKTTPSPAELLAFARSRSLPITSPDDIKRSLAEWKRIRNWIEKAAVQLDQEEHKRIPVSEAASSLGLSVRTIRSYWIEANPYSPAGLPDREPLQPEEEWKEILGYGLSKYQMAELKRIHLERTHARASAGGRARAEVLRQAQEKRVTHSKKDVT